MPNWLKVRPLVSWQFLKLPSTRQHRNIRPVNKGRTVEGTGGQSEGAGSPPGAEGPAQALTALAIASLGGGGGEGVEGKVGEGGSCQMTRRGSVATSILRFISARYSGTAVFASCW